MSTSSSTRAPRKPIKLNPLPKYPEIILALTHIQHKPRHFHWLIFVPNPGVVNRQTASPGKKLHVTQRGLIHHGRIEEVWCYDYTDYTLATSFSLATAVVLGHLPPGKTVEDLIVLLWAIPMMVPKADEAREPKFTCRVWAREAVRRMHAYGYIHCPNVDALEEEILRYGRNAAHKHVDEWSGQASLVQAVNSHAV
ncbi:hypothetical protein C2E23DRAFT_744345 [Lenzites betulinus]|nr:hypothetical protein C2E23DRAFT_744345 [Lenzites betulinus]